MILAPMTRMRSVADGLLGAINAEHQDRKP